MKKYQIIDVVLAVTYRCNSRCIMCNIWKKKDYQELPLEIYSNLPPTTKYLNITGGEPFLHPQFIEVFKRVRHACPKAQIVISSNGFATELILKYMKEVIKIDPTIGIRISLDGIEEMHDRTRGIKGFYGNAVKTLQGLKEIGISNLGLSFTIMDHNATHLPKVYDLSRELEIEMAMAMVQSSDIYFQKEDNKITHLNEVKEGLEYVVKRELLTFKPKMWARAFYDYGLWIYATKKQRLLPSGAGIDSVFIDVDGKYYPSNLISLGMGSLKDGKLTETWNQNKTNIVRNKIKDEKIQESWIICTIRGSIRKAKGKVLLWALANKVKVHLGQNVLK